jgi:RecA/RadA recombinase
MAKKVLPEKSQKSSFSELNDMLSKFSPDGAIIEDSVYAKIDEWITTGSFILNAALSGSLFGGMPNRRSLMFAGETGTGKTYIAMSIVRSAQSMGYFPIYYDSEGSIDVEFVKKLGIDTSKFRLEAVTTIEEFATLAAKLNETIATIRGQGKTPPKIIVVLDSLGNLSSTKEKEDTASGSGKRDMTKQQSIRRMFRVIGNDFAKNAIPFIINNHTYASIGSFIPGQTISGGGGAMFNASIIFTLTKSKLTDKDSEDHIKKQGLDQYTKVGIVVTVHPFKQRFARPIKVQIHIPFYKKPNPYVGLEKFVNWDTCGIVRGNMISEKEYAKLSPAEQKKANPFEITQANKKGEIETVTVYASPKDTARKLVCRHLGGEVPIAELYTPKVFTEEVLHLLDDNIIKKTFMLPSIESLEDLAEVTGDLMDNAEMSDANLTDENQSEDLGEFGEESMPYES